MTEQPTLTDGVVTLRGWSETDAEAAVAGHDAEIDFWFGQTEPSDEAAWRTVIAQWRQDWDQRRLANFAVTADGRIVGAVEVRIGANQVGEVSWWIYAPHRGHGYGTRAVRVLSDWAMTETGLGGLGLTRIEARVEPDNRFSLRVATRSGLRMEGVQRVAPGTGDRAETSSYVVFARLADDPPLSDPTSFRALLNSFLPRKRAITQMLIRDTAGRVLLCQLTYKRDWDLPGGVVEVGESPREAVSREVAEELALEVDAGELLLTDWLPAWGGWDDAICLVWDGGVHEPSFTDPAQLQPSEIAAVHWCTPAQVREHAADFTARRIEAALARAAGATAPYTESGRA